MVISLLLVMHMLSSISVEAFQLHHNNLSLSFRGPTSCLKASRRNVLATTITASSPLVSLLLPQLALAKDESMNYQAVWYDPKHPDGYRILFGDDQKAILLSRDEPTSDEQVIPVEVIPGAEGVGDGTKLRFSGPADMEGIFTRNSNKIRIISFNGGKDFWINKTFEGPFGIFKDSSNSKRIIVIRRTSSTGSDCVVEFRDDRGGILESFTAKAGNTFTIDSFFPDRDVTAAFSSFRRTLTFDDGIIWTKY